MSAIPPPAIGSVLQSGLAQTEQTRPTDAAKNAQAEAARATTTGPFDVLEIEATDADTRVHPESGGEGGQGRYDAPPEENETEAKAEPSAVTVDEQGVQHLDLSA